MIDWLVSTFTWAAVGYIVTFPGIVALVILGVLCAHDDCNKTAVFIGLLLAIASLVVYHVPILLLIECTVGYLTVGVLWSFWRYKRYLNYCIKHKKYKAKYSNSWVEHSNSKNSHTESLKLSNFIDSLHPMQNLDKIVSWILIWPFSVIELGAGDIIDGVQTLVRGLFKGVYTRMYLKAIQPLIEPQSKGRE